MSDGELVRASRDGDQFHYLWAAQRCLGLLSLSSDLVAVSIEGASSHESPRGQSVEEGEEVIDVGEYYGHQELSSARLVRYMQLKHSTKHASEEWTISGLRKTLSGFAERCKALKQARPDSPLDDWLQLYFVTNRPISKDVVETIEDAAKCQQLRHPTIFGYLETYCGLTGKQLSEFCALLQLEPEHAGFLEQRQLLAQGLRRYLPGPDSEAPLQLKELVTRKATTEFASNPQITKFDVLKAIGSTEDDLFPARCLIEPPARVVEREQEAELAQAILDSVGRCLIVKADGGVGKSVLAMRLTSHLPSGSHAVVYDCFGNGAYRSPSGFRHRHKDALVQIANELAGARLCDPLIQSANADSAAYTRAFLARLSQAVASLRARNSSSVLWIVIDAADNAEMAAQENSDGTSFARDLLRERIPDGVCVVVLCRPYRVSLLNPPPTCHQIELLPFTRRETQRYLLQTFPDALEQDVDEFHRLSSQNPRVQAAALAAHLTLPEVLRALGPTPTTVQTMIESLLEQAVARVKDEAGASGAESIDRVCQAMATLRPLIPLNVVSTIASVPISVVRSFVNDLQRPILLRGDLLQFIDEPTETWFQSRFQASGAALIDYLRALQPLAGQSVYVASVLPQLMLEAGQISELVELALTSRALPEENPLERRDLELQRLQFALKACLRAGRHLDASKIALKASGEAAADERQQRLLSQNTDLAAAYIEPERMLELVSRRAFRGKWLGEHYAFEAGFLSGRSELQSDARSRLRIARDWLRHWSSLPAAERPEARIEDEYIAELAIAHLNIHGPEACALQLSGWTPRTVSFRVGHLVAARLADFGRFADIDAIATAGSRNVGLALAMTSVLQMVGLRPPLGVVRRASRIFRRRYLKIRDATHWQSDGLEDRAAAALACAAVHYGVMPADQVAEALRRHYPHELPRGSMSRYGGRRIYLLRVHALLEKLEGTCLQMIDLAGVEIKKANEKANGGEGSRELQEFKESVGALLPWSRLWVSVHLGAFADIDLARCCSEALAESIKAEGFRYHEESTTADEIAEAWAETLNASRSAQSGSWNDLISWVAGLRHPLATPTTTRLIWFAARRSGSGELALQQSAAQFARVVGERADASSTTGALVALARAILPASRSEGNQVFKTAIDIANRVGDESLTRWNSLLCLAERAADPTRPMEELAYRTARAAELIYDYVDRDKHFDWERSVKAVLSLCPNSTIAILSRWRDRRFGRWRRLLPTVVENLLQSGRLSPWSALSLTGFRADWDHARHFSLILDHLTKSSDKVLAASFYVKELQLESPSLDAWIAIRSVAAANGIALDSIDSMIAGETQRQLAERRKEIREESLTVQTLDGNGGPDWSHVFGDHKLHDRVELEAAYAKYRGQSGRISIAEFLVRAIERVQPGHEAAMIEALQTFTELDLWDYQRVLSSLPEQWLTRISVRPALRTLIRSVVATHCLQLSPGMFYEQLPLDLASRLSGSSRAELCAVALDAVGRSHAVLDAQNLFRVVNLLSETMTRSESQGALGYGLDLLDVAMRLTDGDGPWKPELRPAATIEANVAGYVWAALASPEASIRWEAAHVVRYLSRFGQVETIDALFERLRDPTPGPFADQSLFFYSLHAQQWMLIALARAALEAPAIIGRYVSPLRDIALGREPHVLMRQFATDCLFSVSQSAPNLLSKSDLERLHAVNRSPFDQIVSKRYERTAHSTDPVRARAFEEESRFLIGYDFKKHWPDNLGRRFAISGSTIERMIGDVIWDDWQLEENGHWDRDERGKRKHFERRNSYSYGDDERCSNLSNYLSYHAIMVVAGKLLSTIPTHTDPDDTDDGFTNWLRSHALSRPDGAWLADLRDPVPFFPSGDIVTPSEEDWPTSVQRDHFKKHLLLPDGHTIVAGCWAVRRGRRIEEVRVTSALVEPSRASALVHALQCARTPFEHHLPMEGDRSEIDSGPFRLLGWTSDPHIEKGIDQYDPWAGSIDYPPYAPSSFFAQKFGLSVDTELRTWIQAAPDCRGETMGSAVWGTWEDPNQDDYYEGRRDSGRILTASPALLRRLCADTGMQLIFDVRVERNLARSRYGAESDDSLGYVFPSTGIILLIPDGNYYSVV